MTQFFDNLLNASFHGSIVILAVIVLRVLLKKTPKKFFCMLWLLAGIRLLMPFEIQSTLSLQPSPEPMFQQVAQYEVLNFTPVEPMIPIQQENRQDVEAAVPVFTVTPAETTPIVQESVIHQETARTINWMSMIPWIWLTVASFFLVYTFYAYFKLRLQVREAVKIEGGWECDRIETAFILGFIRPQIYIPMGLSAMVRKYILAHERTHLEKGDHWFKMISFIALALHWFNPLVWVAYILLCKDIEMACDERVVQFMDLKERKEYSAALLNCSTNKVHFAACPVAFGEVSVKHRIKSVLKYKKPSFWISLAGVIAIIFVAVCLVTSPTEKGSEAAVAVDGMESVTVENVDEFIAAIGPNREIILKPGTYNLCEAKTYGKDTNNDYCAWEGSYDGSEFVIRSVENFAIRGNGRLSTIIETDPRWANVIRIQNSTDVTLEGFTAGHTRLRGECSGGVLYLEGCTNTAMKDLGLYGCGVVGLTAHLCTDITLTGSEIYECSSSAMNLHTSSNVSVSDCRVYDIGLKEYGGYTFFEMANSQNVTVSNCEFSVSTLSNLLVSSGTQATFRNNLFVGNRIRGGALNITGQNVILEDNRFEGNSIRSWYDSYGNLASDAQGNALTEAVLKEMYPAAPIQPTQPQLEIHVKTVDELIAAIGPNKDIVLEGEFYDFSKATGYGTSSGDYYYWEDVHDGPGLVIRNVDNMTIRSIDGNVKNHTISAIPRYADVLAFSACSNVTLSGFTAGHTIEPGSCAGGVIEFRDCDNMLVDNCGLYGCGILGVYAEYSKNIYVTNSDIYECSQGGIQMRSTDNITISGNTFRDLGGEETSFISCTNVNLDGQLLNPQSVVENIPVSVDPTETPGVIDQEDFANLSETVTHFSYALFRDDEATMRLHLAKSYDTPIEISEAVQGAMLAAEQDIPTNYPAEMESKGYCTVAVRYYLPDSNDMFPSIMMLEMCRENGIWKVQYYSLGDTEVELLDKDLWNFFYAYLEQDLEGMEMFLSEEYTGTVDVYFGSAGNAYLDKDYSVGNTFSNAQLVDLDSYSAAIPFKEDGKSGYTYLNVALRRRENPKTVDENGLVRHEPEWEVLDYGVENQAPNPSNIMYLPGNIQIETIERENYTGTVMLIEDPSRIFLGTSTQEAFSKDVPGKRINEMFEVYPEAIAAVNAGAFFDDGTASTAVGSYPLGLTVSNGEIVWSQGEGLSPGYAGFVGFDKDNKLIIVDHNLTHEEAEALNIRDGVGVGPALICDMEVLPAANENSGYNPRTAIGQREDGTVILLCINGRVFNSLGATYEDVANEMMTYGAENACMMHGGSATAMMYRPNSTREPELLTTVSTMNGEKELQPRRLPTYWMVVGE